MIKNSIYPKVKLALLGGHSGLKAVFWLFTAAFFVSLFCSKITLASILLLLTAIAVTRKYKVQVFKNPWKPLFISFGIFVLISFASSFLLNEPVENSSGFGRVLIWAACLMSGFIFSRAFPDHDYKFLKPLLLILPLAFLIILAVNASGLYTFNIFLEGQLIMFTATPSRIGIICVFILLYCLNLFIFSKHTVQRVRRAALAFILLVMVYMTLSRTILFLTPLAVLFLTSALPASCRRKHLLAFVGICLLLGAAVFALTTDKQQQRVTEVLENPLEVRTVKSRMPLWEIGWESFKEAPLFGHGVQSYKTLHKAYMAKHKEELLEKYKFVEESNWHPHNIILGKLVDTGIAGTICFFIFYGLGFYYALRTAKPENRWPAAFLAFYFLVGMVDDSLARLNDSFVITLIGLAAALPQSSARSGQAQELEKIEQTL